MPSDRRLAADYIAKADEFDHERGGGMGRGEVARTLVVAAVFWGALALLTRGESTVVAGGWIAGLVFAVAVPYLGRWIAGESWNDPKETRTAAEREERQQNMAGRGRWATDPELIREARERAQREGGPFPGSDDEG